MLINSVGHSAQIYSKVYLMCLWCTFIREVVVKSFSLLCTPVMAADGHEYKALTHQLASYQLRTQIHLIGTL